MKINPIQKRCSVDTCNNWTGLNYNSVLLNSFIQLFLIENGVFRMSEIFAINKSVAFIVSLAKFRTYLLLQNNFHIFQKILSSLTINFMEILRLEDQDDFPTALKDLKDNWICFSSKTRSNSSRQSLFPKSFANCFHRFTFRAKIKKIFVVCDLNAFSGTPTSIYWV